MTTITLFVLYASIAAAVAGHAFYFGVLNRPRVSVFTLSDYGILAITTLAIGAAWPIFIPALLVIAVARGAHAIRLRSRGWSLPRAQHARAGS